MSAPPVIVDLGSKLKHLRRRLAHLRLRLGDGPNRDLSFDLAEASALEAAIAALEYLRAQHAAERAPAPIATVEALLFPATVVVESMRGVDWLQFRHGNVARGETAILGRWRHVRAPGWSSWLALKIGSLAPERALPARLVPLDQADLDPATRGPIPGCDLPPKGP